MKGGSRLAAIEVIIIQKYVHCAHWRFFDDNYWAWYDMCDSLLILLSYYHLSSPPVLLILHRSRRKGTILYEQDDCSGWPYETGPNFTASIFLLNSYSKSHISCCNITHTAHWDGIMHYHISRCKMPNPMVMNIKWLYMMYCIWCFILHNVHKPKLLQNFAS